MLYFSNVQCSIFTFLFRLIRCLHVTRNLRTLLEKTLSNPNCSPVYMKINYLFNLCLFKVGRLFCKLGITKLFVSSLFSSVKKRNILCSGERCEIKRKMYRPGLLLLWVSVSTVGYHMGTLYYVTCVTGIYIYNILKYH